MTVSGLARKIWRHDNRFICRSGNTASIGCCIDIAAKLSIDCRFGRSIWSGMKSRWLEAHMILCWRFGRCSATSTGIEWWLVYWCALSICFGWPVGPIGLAEPSGPASVGNARLQVDRMGDARCAANCTHCNWDRRECPQDRRTDRWCRWRIGRTLRSRDCRP